MKRGSIVWTPDWEGVVEGLAVNMIRRNLWRVAPLYDWDDLIQDARLTFLRLVERYPDVVEPKAFVSLFRRAFGNHLHDLANQRTWSPKTGLVTQGEDGDPRDLCASIPARDPGLDEEAFAQRLAGAPEPIRALVEGLERKGRPKKHRRNRYRRETTNEYLCRIAGLDPQAHDLRAQLYSFLGIA